MADRAAADAVCAAIKAAHADKIIIKLIKSLSGICRKWLLLLI